MKSTTHLGLKVVDSAEWSTVLFRDFVNAFAANDDASNMAILDQAIGAMQQELNAAESALAKV